MSFNYKKYKKILDFCQNIKKSTIYKHDPKIIAVTKGQTTETIESAISHGVRIFGENKIQELEQKYDYLIKKHKDLSLHFLGHLQTNKVKKALKYISALHTLDSEKLAKEITKHTGLYENKIFFIQINTGDEEQKSGINIFELKDFLFYCKNDLKLNIVGLMCIPPINENPIKHFKLLKDIAQTNELLYLSMGMSNDYIEALNNGATHIRIGTELFGPRTNTT